MADGHFACSEKCGIETQGEIPVAVKLCLGLGAFGNVEIHLKWSQNLFGILELQLGKETVAVCLRGFARWQHCRDTSANGRCK